MNIRIHINNQSIARALLIVLVTLFLISCGKNSSQQGLASVAFKYLKYNDFESYSKYIMTNKEALSLLQTLERSGQFKAYSIKKKTHFYGVKKSIKKLMGKQKKQLEKNFYAVFDQGVRHGITWSRTKFVEARVSKQEKVFDLNGLKQQNIYIVFTHKKKEYTLRLKNNIKANRGWIIVDGLSWEPALPTK